MTTEKITFSISGITNSNKDYEALKDILKQSAIDPETFKTILLDVNSSINSSSSDYSFFAIRESIVGKIVGIVGLRPPEGRLQNVINTSPDDLELIHFIIHPDYRNQRLDKKLLDQVIISAKRLKYKRILWSSGRAYEITVSDLFNEVGGEIIMDKEGFFEDGTSAQIWEIKL